MIGVHRKYASDELIGDKEVIITAVKNDGFAMKFAKKD